MWPCTLCISPGTHFRLRSGEYGTGAGGGGGGGAHWLGGAGGGPGLTGVRSRVGLVGLVGLPDSADPRMPAWESFFWRAWRRLAMSIFCGGGDADRWLTTSWRGKVNTVGRTRIRCQDWNQAPPFSWQMHHQMVPRKNYLSFQNFNHF